MILADALSYAKKYSPELVIDVATLTGAADIVAGHHAIVGMGNNEDYLQKLKETATSSKKENISTILKTQVLSPDI